MSEKSEKKYTLELLKSKTGEELIEIIDSLQEEVAMLDFLIAEYEGAQASLGKAIEEQLAEHYKTAIMSKTEGEA